MQEAAANNAATQALIMTNLCDLTFSTHCSSNVHSKSNCGGLGEGSLIGPLMSNKQSQNEAVIDKLNDGKGNEEQEFDLSIS